MLLRETCFAEGKFSVTYLGVPIVYGCLLERDLEP